MTPRHYSFDPERCCVWVNARSSVHPINTETRGLGGWVEMTLNADGSLNMDVGVTGRLELSVDRLSSGNQLYDRELKRRIDARKYPLIEGQITRVEPASEPGLYLVTGDLTFHGRTRTFEHEMTITAPDDSSISLTGDYVFDIREFNMKPPSMLMLKVYPEVGVRVELIGTLDA